MSATTDTLRDNTGKSWEIGVSTSGELSISTPDFNEWTDGSYSSDSWTDATYSSDSWTDESY